MKPLTTRTAPPTATPAAGESARPDELAGSSREVDKKLILEVAELSVDYARCGVGDGRGQGELPAVYR